MNGCWRTEDEIRKNRCLCIHYDKASARCLSDNDTVSKKDGQPMCPRNPDAVARSEWDKSEKEREENKNNEDLVDRFEKRSKVDKIEPTQKSVSDADAFPYGMSEEEWESFSNGFI